jgi:hypothetical protein
MHQWNKLNVLYGWKRKPPFKKKEKKEGKLMMDV